MRDPPQGGEGGNPWRPGSEESFGSEKKQAAQGEAIGKGVRLGKGGPEEKLVERVKGERPDQSTKRIESPSEHSQDQRHDGKGRGEDDGRLDAPDEVGVKSARNCGRRRAQRQRAPARRDEVDAEA